MRNKTTAALLALFVGWLGIHKFYLGEMGKGIVYLLFCWTLIPAIISIFSAIGLFSMDYKRFDKIYN